jgi:hypothetical protein
MKQITLISIACFVSSFSFAQSVGIGTLTPDSSAALHVVAIDSGKGFLVTGTETSTGTVPILGAGTRMMFYPGKSAFRAGTVTGTQWEGINAGLYSAAFGYNCMARGQYGFATGRATKARATSSFAGGDSSFAGGNFSFAFGSLDSAGNTYSIAIGNGAYIPPLSSIQTGSSVANAYASMALNGGSAKNIGAFSLGYNALSSGVSSTSIGPFSTAIGDESSALGVGTIASSYYSTALGSFNDTIATSSATAYVATDPLLIIGNGSGDLTRSNAMVILKNGNTGIGVNNPTTNKLEVNGNTETDSLQIGGTGSKFSKMLSGSTLIGSSGTVETTVTVVFPTAFASEPRVICSVVNDDPAQPNVNDAWVASVRNISTTQCVVNIYRIDNPSGWSSAAHLSWIAFTN